MKVTVFEGIGGSGKTTLINLIRKRDPLLRYVHEDRDPAPESVRAEEMDDYFLRRNITRMNAELEGLSSYPCIVFDRSYISAVAVSYGFAKKRGELFDINPQLEYIYLKIKKEIDNLVICMCEANKAVARRTKRDGFAHPLWSDIRLVSHINQFYVDYGSKFARRTIYLNGGDDEVYADIAEDVTDERLDKLAKEIL